MYMYLLNPGHSSHLEVTKERSLYRKVHDTAKESIHGFFSPSGVFTPNHAHGRFELTQQVFYPNDPLQPGCLTPGKCSIFAKLYHAKSSMRQLTWGKVPMRCSNTSSKYMGLMSILHADNCGGQNKNNVMVGYLLWRVLTEHHFMIAGHTKFSPDYKEKVR